MSNLLSLPTGTVLAGDYEIERVLGAGGFGVTYLAREADVDRHVTIKEYFPTDFALRDNDLMAVPRSQGSSEDYEWGLDRFIDEARTLGKFNHNNIVRLYRYFRENNTAYMVLHFEEGQSLKAWLARSGRTPRQNELDKLVEPLLDALNVIHQADFLHRDIAPDNIIVRSDGSPVLIDFGSARGEIAKHTRTISALVKPGYSPYEQYAETGAKQGPWTDIYAFAGTLYHAVTGKRPPDAPSRVIKDELRPTEETATGAFRQRFLRAIDKGLRLAIDERPQSIAEWRGELLAPEERPSGWFSRGREAEDDPARPVVSKDTPTRPVTTPLPVAPPPDVPDAQGGLVEYVERLRGDGGSAMANDSEPAAVSSVPGAAEEIPELPPPRTSLRSRLRLGWGVGRKAPGEANAGKSAAKASQSRATARTKLEAAPGVSSDNAQSLPVAVPDRSAPRVLRRARPRPIRGLSKPRWRPLLFKLLIGFGVATGAVAMQDRLPKFEFRGTGTVSSATKSTQSPASRVVKQPQQHRKPAPRSLLLHRFSAHTGGVSKAAFAKGGQVLVTAGAKGTIKVWNADQRNLIRTIELDDGPATALAGRGNLVLTGHSEGIIALWNIDTGLKQRSFKRNDATIWAVVFAGRDDRFWAAGHDWTVSLWEVRTPSAPLQVLQGHENPVQALAFSPATALLASGGADKTIRLWNSVQVSLVRTYTKAPDFVTALAFSPDGQTLVAGTLDGQVRIMATGRRRYRTLSAHSGRIVGLAFDSDETFLSAGKNGRIRKWTRKRRRALATFGSAGNALTAFAVAPGRTRLVTGDEQGFVTIWRIP